MFFDTHAHLNFSAFDSDRDEVMKKCLNEDIWMINIGTNYETSQKAVEIAEKYNQGIYAAVGLHPINLETDLIKQKEDKNEGGRFENGFDYEKYKKLALISKKVVAIGEIGLDFWRRPKTNKKKEEFKQEQKNLLLQEIKLAQELNLPIIFHCRLGFDDLLKMNEVQPPSVIHSFTGTWQQAKQFLDMGFYLGFNGIIYKLDLREVIQKTPLDRILIETDCPYLTPPNFPEERNNPLGVKHIIQEIANIKNISFEQVVQTALQNAKTLFRI